MPSVRYLSIAFLFIAVTSAAAQVPADIKSAAGCYSLTMTAWSPVIGSDSAYHRLPTAIRLDTVRSTVAPGWALSPNIAYPHGRGMLPTWRLATDTMRLAWSDGAVPTYVTLVRRDSGWVGDAVAQSDDHPDPATELPHAQVTAHRQACAAPPSR